MTLTSENIQEIAPVEITQQVFKRGRGRPTGVKNGNGAKKKPVKKPRVVINTDAIVANAALKKANQDIAKLTVDLEMARKELYSANMHIEKVEKHHKAALVVIGYLEGKLFNP
jgi:hypothetical protein